MVENANTISSIAMKRFDGYWNLFNHQFEEFGGAVFSVFPFKRYFSSEVGQNRLGFDIL
jgi:hypothetical protein